MERNLIGEMEMLRESGAKPNFTDLARRYGLDRHTVAKYWRGGAGAEDGRSARPSGFDAYRDEIEAKAGVPGMTIKAIHEFLLDRHAGEPVPGYGALKHYVAARGIRVGGREPEAHPRFETEPGRQLQFDWKEGMSLRGRDGGEYRFSVWTATLGWSRRHVFLRTASLTTDDFVACAWQTARRLGGVPAEWLTDNMSAIVTVGPDGRRRRSARAFSFAERMGFRIQLCAPRTPQTKGKDESANRFLNRLLAYDGEVGCWGDVDAAIARIEARSNEEANQDTGLPPDLLFLREKEALGPLPPASEAMAAMGEVSRQVVPATMLVRYRGREWSVPRRCIGRGVRLVGMPGGQLRVYLGGELVAVHDTTAGGRVNYDPARYAEALAGKRWAADRDIEEAARRNLELLGGLGGDGE